MVKIIIYAGLSLPFSEAKDILDSTEDIEVIYKKPIQRGDLTQALNENPDIIVWYISVRRVCNEYLLTSNAEMVVNERTTYHRKAITCTDFIPSLLHVMVLR